MVFVQISWLVVELLQRLLSEYCISIIFKRIQICDVTLPPF